MKRRFIVACIAASVMALSFAVPVMAVEVTAEAQAVALEYVAIERFNEPTQIYFRTMNGVLQFRVWGTTSGRWLTDWIPL